MSDKVKWRDAKGLRDRIDELEANLATARNDALDEAAKVGGDAAVKVLLIQEPGAIILHQQLVRQIVATPIRALKDKP